MFGLALEDLLDEVVDDEAVVPGEARDEARDVVATLHRQRRELERGDPPLGTSHQRGDLVGRQRQPHHVAQVRRYLVGCEAQVGGADLDQLPAGAEPGEGEGRVYPGGDDQVDLRREVVQQEGHPVVDVPRLDHVVVVEDQHEVVLDGLELVEQGGEDLVDRRLRGLQQGERSRADPGDGRPHGAQQVRPECRRIVVPLVEGQPGDEPALGPGRRQPLHDERGLAEPGGRGHQDEARWLLLLQEAAQPRSRNQATPPSGHVQLGLQEGACHDHLPKAREPDAADLVRRCRTVGSPSAWCQHVPAGVEAGGSGSRITTRVTSRGDVTATPRSYGRIDAGHPARPTTWSTT